MTYFLRLIPIKKMKERNFIFIIIWSRISKKGPPFPLPLRTVHKISSFKYKPIIKQVFKSKLKINGKKHILKHFTILFHSHILQLNNHSSLKVKYIYIFVKLSFVQFQTVKYKGEKYMYNSKNRFKLACFKGSKNIL